RLPRGATEQGGNALGGARDGVHVQPPPALARVAAAGIDEQQPGARPAILEGLEDLAHRHVRLLVVRARVGHAEERLRSPRRAGRSTSSSANRTFESVALCSYSLTPISTA